MGAAFSGPEFLESMYRLPTSGKQAAHHCVIGEVRARARGTKAALMVQQVRAMGSTVLPNSTREGILSVHREGAA
jgi:hypothetical protein